MLGTGRVYLIIAEARNVDGRSAAFDVCKVVVPRSNTPDDIASVEFQSLGAATWYRQYQTAPRGLSLLGEGPGNAPRPGSRNGVEAAISFGQVVWKSPASPALLASTITAMDRSVVPMPLEVQPVSPTLAEAAPAPVLHWEGRRPRTPRSRSGTRSRMT
jgi:hypothetical protein